jgi:hypothetical protein
MSKSEPTSYRTTGASALRSESALNTLDSSVDFIDDLMGPHVVRMAARTQTLSDESGPDLFLAQHRNFSLVTGNK